MKFSIYLDDNTGRKLRAIAQQTGENPNALVQRAIQEALQRLDRPQWRDLVVSVDGIPEYSVFTASCYELEHAVVD